MRQERQKKKTRPLTEAKTSTSQNTRDWEIIENMFQDQTWDASATAWLAILCNAPQNGKAGTVEEVIMPTLYWCTETVFDSHKWERHWFVLRNVDILDSFVWISFSLQEQLADYWDCELIKIHRDRNIGLKDCFALELWVAVIQFSLSILVMKWFLHSTAAQ